MDVFVTISCTRMGHMFKHNPSNKYGTIEVFGGLILRPPPFFSQCIIHRRCWWQCCCTHCHDSIVDKWQILTWHLNSKEIAEFNSIKNQYIPGSIHHSTYRIVSYHAFLVISYKKPIAFQIRKLIFQSIIILSVYIVKLIFITGSTAGDSLIALSSNEICIDTLIPMKRKCRMTTSGAASDENPEFALFLALTCDLLFLLYNYIPLRLP